MSTLSKAECIITGDSNIDLLKNESHIGTGQFINSLLSHSLIPTIIKPTRFGRDTSTLIHNIFVNKPNNASISGLLITDISDHLSIFYITKSKIKKITPKYIAHCPNKNILYCLNYIVFVCHNYLYCVESVGPYL